MINMDDLYAVETLKAWYQDQLRVFQEYCISYEFNNSGHGSASVELETNKYLIEVSAWNQASCLDIQIIDIESEECKFPTVGDCKTKIIFKKHLESFVEWFKSENINEA